MPQGRYTNVIERLKPGAAEAGDIVHVDGRVLGRHDGIINYTIGQRRGLGIAGPAPLYVVRLDADNAARWSSGRARACMRTWITPEERELAGRRCRSHGAGSGRGRAHALERAAATGDPVSVRRTAPGVVLLRDGEYGIAAGQACVFYADARSGGACSGRRMDRRSLEPGRAAASRLDGEETAGIGVAEHVRARRPYVELRGDEWS